MRTGPEAASFGPDDLGGWDPAGALGAPGSPPYTRGPHPGRHRAWTVRQLADAGSPALANLQLRDLLAAGHTELGVVVDLPTRVGQDSDDPRAKGRVGRAGVAVDTVADVDALLAGIPLGEVGLTLDAGLAAPALLATVELVAEDRGVPLHRLRGALGHDPLGELAVRGTATMAPASSLRRVVDLVAHCHRLLPGWDPLSVSGYELREAGATAGQEVGLALAHGLAYRQALRDGGLDLDAAGGRPWASLSAHNDLFAEVAKLRAARRLWYRLTGRGPAPAADSGRQLRVHVRTAASTLTAVQPELNVVRVSVQALAAVLGGAESLHVSATEVPSPATARLAVGIQQVLALETGITAEADPLGGSYYLEWLTDAIEAEAAAVVAGVERLGGAVAALETGHTRAVIEASAYDRACGVEDGRQVVVGLNRFVEPPVRVPGAAALDPGDNGGPGGGDGEARARLLAWRRARPAGAVAAALDALEVAVAGGTDAMAPLAAALGAGATLGEATRALGGKPTRRHPGRASRALG